MTRIGIRALVTRMENGVRESQEEYTMAMVNAVRSLLENNVFDRNGVPVKCIIADTTIGGAKEAADCTKKFAEKQVCASITVTTAWSYPTEVIEMDPQLPKAIWGINGTDTHGAVTTACIANASALKGRPIYVIYGKDVQDNHDDSIPDDVKEKLLRFARAAVSVDQMKGKSLVSFGSVSMGIASAPLDPAFFEEYFGMRVEYCDMSEIARRMDLGIYDEEELSLAYDWVKQYCKEGKNNNTASREELDEAWRSAIKVTMIVRDIMVGNEKLAGDYHEESLGRNAIMAGFQGKREWSDHFPDGIFMETMINSSFDWNGRRPPYIVANENDSHNGVSMLMNNLLGGGAQMFLDVRSYWSPEAVERVTGMKLPAEAENGVIHLSNESYTVDATGEQQKDGKPAMKPFWEITDDEVKKCMDATTFYPQGNGNLACSSFTDNFLTKPGMPITMVRLNYIKGLGPVLQLAEGYSVNLPKEMHDIIDQRTDPEMPTTYFVPRLTGEGAFTSVYDVMQSWGSNHAAASSGHIGADLITLCSMLRIHVCMHNVDNEKVFRPAVWKMMGTECSESADLSACNLYGPLYK